MTSLWSALLALSDWRARALSAVAGLLAASGQAPLGLWWLALAGFALLAATVAAAPGAREGGMRAFWGGAAHFVLSLSWIVEPFLVDAPRHGWMAPFALLFMSFGLALFWAAAGALAHRGRPVTLAFAVALAATEYLRGHILTGFPWAVPGQIWTDTPVAMGAAVIGADGLTLLTLLIAGCAAAGRIGGLQVAVILWGLSWGAGQGRLGSEEPPDRAVTLRLVQPNTPQDIKWDADIARSLFDTLLAMTAAPGTGPRPDLVIWPETSVPYLLDTAPRAVAEVGAAGGGVPVAVGIQRSDGALRYFNSLAVIDPGGQVAALYDKHHLVPFGEYMPFGDTLRDWFGITGLAAAEGFGYSAGPGPRVIDLGPTLGRVLPLICYEAVFPGIPRAVPERPEWMLQVTNDAWFGTLSGPYQHLAQARLRAIEMGLPLIRVANTGVSAVIDAKGRIRASMALGTAGVLDHALPAALAPTPFARWGDMPLFLLLAGLGTLLVMRRRTARP
ncbi:MAG: apolipoprotein N-acyltransferase [Gemmobacter sp.]